MLSPSSAIQAAAADPFPPLASRYQDGAGPQAAHPRHALLIVRPAQAHCSLISRRGGGGQRRAVAAATLGSTSDRARRRGWIDADRTVHCLTLDRNSTLIESRSAAEPHLFIDWVTWCEAAAHYARMCARRWRQAGGLRGLQLCLGAPPGFKTRNLDQHSPHWARGYMLRDVDMCEWPAPPL